MTTLLNRPTFHPKVICDLCDQEIGRRKIKGGSTRLVDNLRIYKGIGGPYRVHMQCAHNTVKARLREDNQFKIKREEYINKQFDFWKRKKEVLDNTKWIEADRKLEEES